MNIAKITGLFILLFIIIGCLGSYGKIRELPGTDNKLTLSELRDNWDDYNIYYGKRSIRWADALMFDPKNSDTNLSGDSWTKIEDKETLDEKIKEIQRLYTNPKIFFIEGANKQFFGYMYYSGHFHITLKMVDDRTMYLLPPKEYKSWP